jgi:hypothetical protein
MTKAKRVHSTPPTNTPSYSDLEPDICDLLRLCEMTRELNLEWLQDPTDERHGAHATLMSDILCEKMLAFKSRYYAGFRKAVA